MSATAKTQAGRRYTLEYPELGTGPVPVEPYVSPEYFELERERIFRRVWLHMGRVEEIPNPGDYVVRHLPVARTSILIVRGADGQVRGFHNVCIHRGNKLMWDTQGSRRTFSCKYHGWTYAADGSLIGVPEEDRFFDFDKKKHCLPAVATDVWEGFIFVNLDPDPRQSLAEYMGELVPMLRGYPFDALTCCVSYRAELRANWKVLVDSQQEGYHAKVLHRRSLPGFLENREDPSCHVVGIRLFDRHRLISYFGNRERPPTPSEMIAFKYGPSVAKFSMDQMLAGVNPTKDPNWAFDEYAIFPNFQLLLFAGMFITHTMWPIAVDRAVWEARAYLPAAKTPSQRFSLEYTKVLLRDAWLEDGSTLESTQEGIESGALSHFILQDQELLIRHSAKVVDDYVRAS